MFKLAPEKVNNITRVQHFFFYEYKITDCLKKIKKIVGEDSGYESMWQDKEDSENDDDNAPLSSIS